jgi:hypothetical protein
LVAGARGEVAAKKRAFSKADFSEGQTQRAPTTKPPTNLQPSEHPNNGRSARHAKGYSSYLI